jgi:hypothetical protein
VEQLLNCIEPALVLASDHMIDLVDRVIERNVNDREGNSRHQMFAWFYGIGPQAGFNHPVGLSR